MSTSTSTRHHAADETGTNPYVGPRSLQIDEPIYGRDRELRQLRDSVIADRIVLLYSPSGAGKSSLLEAGLRPALRMKGFEVAPTVRLNHALPGNRYVSSAIQSLDEARPDSEHRDPDVLGGLTLSEYVAGTLVRHDGRHAETCLIFDQFEEVFTLDPTDTKVKSEFFAQLGELLRDKDVWAVIAMREDYIAHLDPHLGNFPRRLATRLRLDFLAERAALAAIRRPAEAAGIAFSEPAADHLVSDLRRLIVTRGGVATAEQGPYVEPVQLQVVCRQLWTRLPPGCSVITENLVEEHADTDNALAQFYAEQVEAISTSIGEPERRIRDWVEQRLITPSGFRSQTFDYPGDHSLEVLNSLENSYLIRAETRRGVKWYELTHDRMIQPVLEDNARWREARLNPFQKLAAEWESKDRPDTLLVSGSVLDEAVAALESADDVTDIERDFVDAARRADSAASAERDRRALEQVRARRRARVFAIVAMVAILALVAAVISAVQANRNGREARRAQAAADASLREAKESEAAATAALEREQIANRTSLARLLTAHSLSTAATNPALAAVLAAESDSGLVPTETISAITNARQQMAGETVQPIRSPHSSPDGTPYDWIVVAPSGDVIAATATAITRLSVPDGEVEETIPAPAADALAIADGLLAIRSSTADGGNSVELWSFAAQASLGTLPMSGSVHQFVLSPDGRFAAGVDAGPLVRVWDTASRSVVGELDGGRAEFSPDSSRLVVETADEIVVHTLPDLATTDRFDKADLDPLILILDLALTNAGDVAAITEAGVIIRWVHGNPDVDSTVPSDTSDEFAWIDLSPDGRRAAVSIEGSLQVWSIDDGEQLSTSLRAGATGYTRDVLFSATGETVVTLDGAGSVQFWSLAAGGPLAQHMTIPGIEWSAAPDGAHLATLTHDGEVAIWNTTTGVRDHVFHVTGDDIELVPSGDALLAFDDEQLSIWDVETESRITTLSAAADEQEALLEGGRSVGTSREGDVVARASTEGLVVWTSRSGRASIPSVRAAQLVVSPDGRFIAGSRWTDWTQRDEQDQVEPSVFVIDVATRDVVAEIPAVPRQMKFALDSSLLAIASGGGALIWTPDGGLRSITESPAFAVAVRSDHVAAFVVIDGPESEIIVVDGEQITGSVPISPAAIDLAFLRDDLILVRLVDASPVSSLLRIEASTSTIVHERLLLSSSAQMTAGGTAVVAATTDGIAFFDPDTLRQIGLVEEYESDVVAMETDHNFATVDYIEGGLELKFFDVLSSGAACELAAPYVTVQQVREVIGQEHQMQTCRALS